jgi:uncharacterized membrane protein YecN with MAPEG domain
MIIKYKVIKATQTCPLDLVLFLALKVMYLKTKKVHLLGILMLFYMQALKMHLLQQQMFEQVVDNGEN